MPGNVTLTVDTYAAIRHHLERRGVRLRDVEKLAMERYCISVNPGHLSNVLNRKVAQPSPNHMAALLLILELEMEDVGMDPAEYPLVAAALFAHRHGFRWPTPPSDETKTTHTYLSGHQAVTRQAA